MSDVEKIARMILGEVGTLGPELASLLDSHGRILAESVVAQKDMPPRNNSAMDGYAFLHPGRIESPLRLEVIERIAAGHDSKLRVGPGRASKIMTGAMLPEAADTVVPVELAERDGPEVIIREPPEKGANVRLAGADVARGVQLLARGTRIRPAEVGMLASQGRSYVKVHRRPRVAILATGDEITEIDRGGDGARIVNSNSYSLAAMVAEAGGLPLMLPIGRDDPDELLGILECAGPCDVIITTGGISMGDFDFIPEVFSRFGVRAVVDKEMMRPRKPMLFGMRGECALFGLTGNPVSSMVYFEQFVRPAMRKMAGFPTLFRPVLTARYGPNLKPVACKARNTEYVSCRLEREGDGFVVTSIRFRDFWMTSTIEKVNAFLVLEPGEKPVRPGDRVKVSPYDYEFLENG